MLDVNTRARSGFDVFPSGSSMALITGRASQTFVDDLQVAIAG